jgi:hypothetical protein
MLYIICKDLGQLTIGQLTSAKSPRPTHLEANSP